MDKAKLKRELERLVNEAPQFAPSITRFKEQGAYGNVTDEGLDQQNFVRWEVEAASILQELAVSGVSVFKNLHGEYVKTKDASKKYHSRSILVHQVQELLAGAIQLMDSTASESTADAAKHSDLNPWQVLRSFLLDLSSYEVPEVVDRAGLTVDWTLTDKENYSDKTRLAAYRPRIDAAYQSLSNNEDRLRVAYVVTQELAKRGSTAALNDALRKIGWELRDDRLVPSGSTTRELFFPDQSQHDAYVEIRTILQKAASKIAIVDPYIDESTLTLLSTCAKSGMSIKILTSKVPPDFALEGKKWLSEHAGSSLEVRTTKEFHDRFIVLDSTACWHVGCSIKDAGNKVFMLSELVDHDNRAALLELVTRLWGAATIVL
jgi:hypothetical protein